MADTGDCLGLCFFGNQLFYGVNDAEHDDHLERIGAVDFNFNVVKTLYTNQQDRIEGLRNSVHDLKKQIPARHINILINPRMECWATLPKLVYDVAEEREAYIKILMNGLERKYIQPSWYTLSKENFKLLQLRTSHMLRGLKSITTGLSNVGFYSAFEIGEMWIRYVRPGGSFLVIGTFDGCVAVSSFILGKLRGATYIEYDDPGDLPYLWLQQSKDLPWMQGLHDQIQVFGQQSNRIIEILEPFWDDAGIVTKMDTLDKMQVQADEQTYGFDLALAYPAVMLALG